MPALPRDQRANRNQVRLQAVSYTQRSLRLVQLGLVLALAGCSPAVVKEPYKVTEVREVYRPIPDEYTRELPTPELPDTITVLDLVTHIKAWQAWGKTANEHRSAVKKLANDP